MLEDARGRGEEGKFGQAKEDQRGPGRRSRLPFYKVVKMGLIKKATFQRSHTGGKQVSHTNI